MLLPLQSLLKFVSLLESWLCQKVRILDKRFPASIIGSFKLKCRPCLCKCDAEMLLWKITFLSSCFKMLLNFLSMLFTSFLSVRTIGNDMTTLLQFGWSLVMFSLTFTKSLYVKSSGLYGLYEYRYGWWYCPALS